MSIRPGAVAVLAALAALVLPAGCSTLPTSGEVSTERGAPAGAPDQVPYFVPPGPVVGADPAAVVRGFLLATQANPPSSSVARSFLSESARSTWRPQGTIVYDTSTVQAAGGRVVARLVGANRLDARGSWRRGSPTRNLELDLDLVQENGEWRIQNPPGALPVPTSYFRNNYVPYLLYFFDRSGAVLVPSRVYLPRGEQVATSLVRGLLAGPPPQQAASTSSGFGPRVGLDLAVVIGEDGVAEVPLSGEVQNLSRADLYRAAVQLAATLRQVKGLDRVRVTVDGVAVPMVNGQPDVGLDIAGVFDPVAQPVSGLLVVRDGAVVTSEEEAAGPIGGPFGLDRYDLRAIAVNARQNLIAGVAATGERVFQAPTTGERGADRVRTVLTGAVNLLRPAYDRYGYLWLVDARASGAVVRVVQAGRPRVVEVPGVSGQRISSFVLTRDGASLIAGLGGGDAPALVVSPLVRAGDGRVVRAGPGQRVPVPNADLAVVVDVAQESATGVAVLTEAPSAGTRVSVVELDGSPGPVGTPQAPTVPGAAGSLLAGPDGQHPVLVVAADGRLYRRGSSGEWILTGVDVAAATYPQ